MRRALIISGGDIDSDFALSLWRKEKADIRIAADRGLAFLRKNDLLPTWIVGDFDSAGEEELSFMEKHPEIPVRRYRPQKDLTDTEIAVRLALELGAKEILILGAMGRRVDHLLANICVLTAALQQGVSCQLLDPWNRIRLADSELVIRRKDAYGKYISLFALGGPVTGLTLEGFQYPLDHYLLRADDPLGVSNELAKEEGRITFEDGILIVAESRDADIPEN